MFWINCGAGASPAALCLPRTESFPALRSRRGLNQTQNLSSGRRCFRLDACLSYVILATRILDGGSGAHQVF
jgi:hypothetical protein